MKINIKDLVNLTSHDIVLYDQSGENVIAVIPPSGLEARVKANKTVVGSVVIDETSVTIAQTQFDDIEGLPEFPDPRKVYIVSLLVLQAARQQGLRGFRLVGPDTGPHSVVKDKNGKIIGVRGFQVLEPIERLELVPFRCPHESNNHVILYDLRRNTFLTNCGSDDGKIREFIEPEDLLLHLGYSGEELDRLRKEFADYFELDYWYG